MVTGISGIYTSLLSQKKKLLNTMKIAYKENGLFSGEQRHFPKYIKKGLNNMNIYINNYEINTNEVISIYTPAPYVLAQKKAGCSVVPEFISYDKLKTYHISIKQTWGMIYSILQSKIIRYMLVYDDPNENKIIQNIVNYAFKQGITVFYRQRSNCAPGFKPIYTELATQHNIYHSLPGGHVEYMGSYYTELPEKHDFKVVPDRFKDKLKRYIKYYDITYPETEYDWYIALNQIKYYHKHKIPYAFDKNKYYICPECKELVLRGTEEEHICFCDIVPERTRMDYILNGEE